jgi:alkylated DNA nucleotide flippase Atl1
MKDITSFTKNVRTAAYPRKRPSLQGISKSHKQTDSPLLYPSHSNIRKSPRNVKAEQMARKREAQISALRREGIYLEEEYREEIRRYMLEMEV